MTRQTVREGGGEATRSRGSMQVSTAFIATFADEVAALRGSVEEQRAIQGQDSLLGLGIEYEAQSAFRALGVRAPTTVPYLPAGSHRRVFLSASGLSRSWHRDLPPELRDDLTFEGYWLPQALEYDFEQILTYAFLNTETVLNAMAAERPSLVVTVRADPSPVTTFRLGRNERFIEAVAQAACARAGVPCVLVEPGIARPEQQDVRERRRALLERGVNALVSSRPLAELGTIATWAVLNRTALGRVARARRRRELAQAQYRIAYWGGTPMKRRLTSRLRRDGDWAFLSLSDGDTPERFNRLRVPNVPLASVVDERVAEAVAVARGRLERAWQHLAGDRAFRDRFSYQGVRLWSALEPRLAYYLEDFLPRALETYVGLRRLISREDIHCLVSSVDVGCFTPWIYRAFRDSGRKSVFLPHGMIFFSDDVVLRERYRSATLPLEASVAAVHGTAYRDWYVDNGVEPERIEVTGAPDWVDPSAQSRRRTSRWTRRLLGLEPDRTTIVYANSTSGRTGIRAYTEETFDEILESTRQVAAVVATELPYQLLVKLHPGIQPERPFRELERLYSQVAVCKHVDIANVLPAADLLITYQSSSGIEALALDLPVIVYNPRGRPNSFSTMVDGAPGGDRGYCLEVKDPALLASAIWNLVGGGPVVERLRVGRETLDPVLLHNRDGRSLDRVVDLIASRVGS